MRILEPSQGLSGCQSKVRYDSCFRINTPDVVQDTIDGEAVIVNLRSGHYYSLENAGAEIWNLVERNIRVSSIMDILQETYSEERATIEQAVLNLIVELQKEELIVPWNETGVNDWVREAAPQKKNFENPRLQKYTDMQDILLLDPIHDVDETGWPNIKIDKPE